MCSVTTTVQAFTLVLNNYDYRRVIDVVDRPTGLRSPQCRKIDSSRYPAREILTGKTSKWVDVKYKIMAFHCGGLSAKGTMSA